jgi:hypothetical protein
MSNSSIIALATKRDAYAMLQYGTIWSRTSSENLNSEGQCTYVQAKQAAGALGRAGESPEHIQAASSLNLHQFFFILFS